MSENNLSSFGNNISSLLDGDASDSGKPLQLDISLVDDDPNNREEINQDFLLELADDIKKRGVKTPVSVREHPSDSTRYMLNYGHNRKHASILAGKEYIPAWIDNDFEDYDQLKENLLKDDISSRDVAKFIKRKLDQGVKKGEIAKNIGKSPAFITQHIALLNLPDVLKNAFDDGRCSDVTLISKLSNLHKDNPTEVENWLSDVDQDVTRGSVKTLDDFISQKNIDSGEVETESDEIDSDENNKKEKKEKKDSDPNKFKKAIVKVLYQGRQSRLILNQRPSEEGLGYIKFDDDGEEIEVNLSDVNIESIIEG